jgi:hypothetical protein
MNERLYQWFGGRSAVCATQHGKEQAMGPLLAQHAGIQLFTLPEFDTDRFGTFTREIPRAGSMIEAARAKAISAAEIACVDLAIASEGSFGPHPSLGLIAGNLEIVLLLDRRHGLEIVGQHLTTNVRWVHGVVHSTEQALELAQRGGFPSHAMVVRRSENDPVGMIKGLNDEESFVQAVQHLLATNEGRPIFIESDLRAHCNPTRMQTSAVPRSICSKRWHAFVLRVERPDFNAWRRFPVCCAAGVVSQPACHPPIGFNVIAVVIS